ncbi:MAG: hypothetical protein IPM43_01870 [Actinomycetota bacterium]|nr:MAG: hypothetical protein IPM43_01870 [Actinomycetota bacterium]
MPRTRYLPEQKAEALQLVASLGQAEAARISGIPFGTVCSWASRAGLKGPEEFVGRQKAVAAKRVAFAERRVDLGNRIGDLAAKIADRIDAELETGTRRDYQSIRNLSGSLSVLVDKAQLLSGGVTTRTEHVERTPEREAEVARVLQLVRSA